MKWMILLLTLGIAEIVTIGELHSRIGTNHLVPLYVVTTAIGAFLLYLNVSEFRSSVKKTKKIQNKLKKKAQGPNYKPTASEIEKLRPLMFVGVFILAIVLVAIPGILSDLIGMVIALPFMSAWVVNQKVKKALANTEL